jgi:sporulation protein YlmC with PRC-barrel domain
MGLVTASSLNWNLIPAFRVIGYYIYDSMDKDIASVSDLLVDSETKRPRYALIEVGGFLSIRGKKILIPWGALRRGGMSRLNVNNIMENVLAAPTPMNPLNPTRVEEESIHRHFNAEFYWLEDEPVRKMGGSGKMGSGESKDQ